jgi:hypothetical protein
MRNSCRDWTIAGLVFITSFALRVPFRSQWPHHWDSAQYALAVSHYDVTISQPQPPGYFVYVMLGRFANLLVRDPHASLVWVSVVAGAALAALGYRLANDMFGRTCGLATGAILASSPLCWFHSEVALTNILDGALVTALAWACWIALRRRGDWASISTMAALLALVAGNRQQTAVIMLPMWLYVLYRAEPSRLQKFFYATTLTGLLSLIWLVPMALMSGGFGRYLEALEAKRALGVSYTLWGGGITNAVESASLLALSCWAGLLLAGLLAGAEIVRRLLRKDLSARTYSDQLWLLGLWIVPAISFGVIIYTLMPGQVLSFFPALAVLTGLAIAKLRGGAALLIGAVVVNAGAFLFEPRLLLLPLSQPAIRAQDERLASACAAIRTRYAPADVVLCHRQEYFHWGMRQFQYCLPNTPMSCSDAT